MRNRILVACVGVPVILVVLFILPEAFTPALIAVLSVIGTYEAPPCHRHEPPPASPCTPPWWPWPFPSGFTLGNPGNGACWCCWSTWCWSLRRPLPAACG